MTDNQPNTDGAPVTPAAFIVLGVIVIVLGVLFLNDDQTALGIVCLIGGAGAGLYGIIAAAVATGMKSARDDDATP